jgi:hypothetical protein
MAMTRFSAYLLVIFALTSAPLLLAQQADQDATVSGTVPLHHAADGRLLPFPNAPFSAEAVTTVNQMLRNGTRLEQSTTARYYRDGLGRLRVELLMDGLRQPRTMSERHIRLTVCPFAREFPDVPEPSCYSLDPVTQTKRWGDPWLLPLTKDGHFLGVPVGGVRFMRFARAQDILRYEPQAVADSIQHEPLGRRRIAGVDTTGERTSVSIPALVHPRNQAPLDLVDEEWESAELGLVIYARYSDSNGGFIEYRLKNIRRAEPSPDLFVIPANYDVAPDSGSKDPMYSSQDGRWVFDELAWSVER